MFAAALGLRAGDGAQSRRALLPIAIGHAASIVIVVLAVTQGILMDRTRVQAVAGAVLVAVAFYRWLRGAVPQTHGANIAVGRRVGQTGIALWSCLMSTAHGAGLMLVPALVPLCLSNSPAREITASGSALLALAAVSVHMLAMLATTGAIAAGVCRGAALHPRLLGAATRPHAWTAALALTGTALLLVR